MLTSGTPGLLAFMEETELYAFFGLSGSGVHHPLEGPSVVFYRRCCFGGFLGIVVWLCPPSC